MTATQTAIVHHYLDLLRRRPQFTSSCNWGTARDNTPWNVDEDTYINGVMMTLDGDYYTGELLEIVERDTGVVSYVALATFHGWFKAESPKGWDYGWDIRHDSMMYEPVCGTFFERTDAADPVVVGQWAVSVIHKMWRAYSEDDSSHCPAPVCSHDDDV